VLDSKLPFPRSPLRYPGGKAWLVPLLRGWLARRSPRLLIEPFAGGGSVSLAAVGEGLVERAVMVELDPGVAAIWHVTLSDHAHLLAERIRAFPFAEATVRDVLAGSADTTLDLAFQTLLRNRVARGGVAGPGAGLIRRGDGGGLGSRWYPESLAERVMTISTLRSRLAVVRGDGLAVLANHLTDADAVAFIDPPYTADGRRPGERLYNHAAVDHERVFELAESFAGDALLTYSASATTRALARRHGFDARPVPMRTTHHARTDELLIARDLAWLPEVRRRRQMRQRVSPKRRDVAPLLPALNTASTSRRARSASVMTAKMPLQMAPAELTAAVPIAEAARTLSVSRRTVERHLAGGTLERADVGDGRTYVTRESLAAHARRQEQDRRRRGASEEVSALLMSMERLMEALRREREQLLTAMREREEVRVELARVQAELAAERAKSAAGPAAGLAATG
jgi:DNA adenine methylase